MTIELTFLGSGNAFAPTRYWSSFLVNGRYLFDAPPTLLAHLKKLDKPADAIDAVFISHFHADHFFGLPFLLLEYAELSPRTRPLTVVGPPGIEARLRTVTDAGFPNVFAKSAGYELHYVEAADGLTGEAGGARFLARQVPHVSGLECFAYRVEIDGRALAYSGDTLMCDALVPLADGADVFVVECSCWGDACGPHLNPKDIRELRRQISPKTKFVLTHLDAGSPSFSLDGTLFAEDFATFNL